MPKALCTSLHPRYVFNTPLLPYCFDPAKYAAGAADDAAAAALSAAGVGSVCGGRAGGGGVNGSGAWGGMV